MTTNADSIYADHLASHAGVTSDEARAAEEAAFAALIEANPEHAGALKELRAAQQRLGGAIPRTLSDKTSGLHRPAGAKELPQSAFHAREGATIGDFRLTHLLGRGGMGEVWEAEQTSLSRKVALKLMLPDRVSERGLDFFAREARAGGRLAHKGIVSVFGTGEDEGAHWIAMELVDGACDLKRSLDAMRDEQEVPEGYYEHTGGFIAELADALEVAHQAGVIHRDLKPANILVAADDSPKVSDFGLAKLEDELSISSAGELLGTYYYMSPEQVATKRAGIDHRTDVFSLGVVMYEMLTLVRPFEGDTTEQVAQKILWEEAPNPKAIRSRVPRDLAVICGKAMEKDPGRRYQSMSELAEDLRRYLGDEPIQAKPPAAAQRVIKWTRRNPTKSALVAAGVAGLAVFGGLWQRAEAARAGEVLARESAEERRLEAEELRAQADENARMAEDARGEAVRKTAELEQVADFQAERLANLDAAQMGWGIRSEILSGAHAAELREGGTEEDAAARELELRALLAGADFTGLAQGVIEEHLLTQAIEAMEGLEDLPLVEARLLSSVAGTARGIGLPERAEAPQARALAAYRGALGEDHALTVAASSDLAAIFADQRRFAESMELLEGAEESALKGKLEDHETWVTLKLNLAICLTGLDRREDAQAAAE
ncbi:MAG: serine/threonine-protein kinase, partial [Planctomycetes bacterium]|nr:serine/threonine-protein kinase [Planctomycetota bacterium]